MAARPFWQRKPGGGGGGVGGGGWGVGGGGGGHRPLLCAHPRFGFWAKHNRQYSNHFYTCISQSVCKVMDVTTLVRRRPGWLFDG